LRHIVDIREGSEITLNLPYLLACDYVNRNDASGSLCVVVLNQLRAPETCSATIEMLTYYSGGNDLEFAVPRQSNFYNPIVPQLGELTSEAIGGDPIKSENTMYASTCIGEKFLSIKQFLNKPTMFTFNSAADPLFYKQLGWIPWCSHIMTNDGGVANQGPYMPLIGGDMFDAMSQMYLFFRGSLRVHVASDSVSTIKLINAPSVNYNATGNQMSPNLSLGNWQYGPYVNNPQTASNTKLTNFCIQDLQSGLVGATIPYYCKTPCSFKFNFNLANFYYKDRSWPDSTISIVKSDDSPFSLFRSCSDDFQLSFFLGAPPCFFAFTNAEGVVTMGGIDDTTVPF